MSRRVVGRARAAQLDRPPLRPGPPELLKLGLAAAERGAYFAFGSARARGRATAPPPGPPGGRAAPPRARGCSRAGPAQPVPRGGAVGLRMPTGDDQNAKKPPAPPQPARALVARAGRAGAGGGGQKRHLVQAATCRMHCAALRHGLYDTAASRSCLRNADPPQLPMQAGRHRQYGRITTRAKAPKQHRRLHLVGRALVALAAGVCCASCARARMQLHEIAL